MQRTTMPRSWREAPRRPKSYHPHLEIMEDRLLMSSVPSTSINPDPNAIDSRLQALRAALVQFGINLDPNAIDSHLQALRAALLQPGPPSNNQHQPAFDNSNLNFTQINQDGFGDNMNSYSWSMAWFNGKLYVGTMRGNASASVVDPTIHYKNNDVAAEIWAYTPETGTWQRVYKSPTDIPIPGQPGQYAAEDNGFRDMFVYTDPNTGQQMLLVGGVVFPSAAPGVNVRPRLLYTTDGVNFQAVPQDPGTFLGNLDNAHGVDSIRAMTEYNGKLYLTAGSLLGEGRILESANPVGGNNNFSQVSPPGMIALELQVYNNYLYVGTAAISGGYSVFKMDAGHNFTPVVTNGAYGSDITGSTPPFVVSMAVFKGQLYVGSTVDLIRIDTNDTWQLIVGNPRQTPQGPMAPLSGLTEGFGNPFTGHIWRLQEYGGQLYAGTWDTAVYAQQALRYYSTPYSRFPTLSENALQTFGLYANASAQAGFDLWTSGDGVSWTRITHTGFGDPFNAGVRSLLATPIGLAVGSINAEEGTQVWIGVPNAASMLVAAPVDNTDQTPGATTQPISANQAPGATKQRAG